MISSLDFVIQCSCMCIHTSGHPNHTLIWLNSLLCWLDIMSPSMLYIVIGEIDQVLRVMLMFLSVFILFCTQLCEIFMNNNNYSISYQYCCRTCVYLSLYSYRYLYTYYLLSKIFPLVWMVQVWWCIDKPIPVE